MRTIPGKFGDVWNVVVEGLGRIWIDRLPVRRPPADRPELPCVTEGTRANLF